MKDIVFTADQVVIGSVRKDIEKEDMDRLITKACEWMRNTLYIHTEINEDKDWCETNRTDWVTSDYDTVEDFINGFIKAMEA